MVGDNEILYHNDTSAILCMLHLPVRDHYFKINLKHRRTVYTSTASKLRMLNHFSQFLFSQPCTQEVISIYNVHSTLHDETIKIATIMSLQ